MAQPGQISVLFIDIGGVLLTNGWDRNLRRKAAEVFELDFAELDERHHLTFDVPVYAVSALEHCFLVRHGK